MIRWNKILVPVDFSDFSRAALADADALAAASGSAQLVLIHVHTIYQVAMFELTYTEAPQEVARATTLAQEKLDAWAAELKTPRSRVVTQVLTGIPAEQVIEQSKQCDLVVMGTHGYTGIKRFLLGSVAERVVQGAHCSVLISRPKV